MPSASTRTDSLLSGTSESWSSLATWGQDPQWRPKDPAPNTPRSGIGEAAREDSASPTSRNTRRSPTTARRGTGESTTCGQHNVWTVTSPIARCSTAQQPPKAPPHPRGARERTAVRRGASEWRAVRRDGEDLAPPTACATARGKKTNRKGSAKKQWEMMGLRVSNVPICRPVTLGDPSARV